MTLQSSRAVATVGAIQAVAGCSDQLLFNPNGNTNINLSFPSGQVHPSISLSVSHLTGESNVADYQDCGVSPIFLSGESPWDSNLEASGPQARDKAKMRYNEKKKARTYVIYINTFYMFLEFNFTINFIIFTWFYDLLLFSNFEIPKWFLIAWNYKSKSMPLFERI